MTTRIPELDAIRGLAALGVVLYHAFPYTFSCGWSCVDCFFVLSGFLITSIILGNIEKPGFLGRFIVRRVRRIWPVYFLTLIFVLTLNYFSRTGFSIGGLWTHLVFLQNTESYFGFPRQPFIHSFSPSWSVAIEEQFYIFWPLLLLLLGRASAPFLAFTMLAMCYVYRAGHAEPIDLLLTRADGLAIGCMLGWLMSLPTSHVLRKRIPIILWSALGIGSAYVAVYLFNFADSPEPKWTHTCFSGFSLLFCSAIGLSVHYTAAMPLRCLRIGILIWLGTISYGLYMFHMPVFTYCPTILQRIGIASPIIHVSTTWIMIFLLPAISWYFIERPILHQKTSHEKPPIGDAMKLEMATNNPMDRSGGSAAS